MDVKGSSWKNLYGSLWKKKKWKKSYKFGWVNADRIFFFCVNYPFKGQTKQQFDNHNWCQTKMAAYNFQVHKPQDKTA